jgi:hypothetical protein
MYPHRIRLRGPWEYERLDTPGGGPPPSGRLVLPCAPGDTGLAGPVRFRRRFGYPGRIDAHERVWLVFDDIVSPVRVGVNGTDLGVHAGALQIDVSHLLGSRNELTAEVAALRADSAPWAEAALEVRCTAYLRNVRVAWAGEELVASGEVVGEAPGPLELYLVADRSPAGYMKVNPAGSVLSFELRTVGRTAEGGPIGRVKLELVQGAVVWYTVELAVPSYAIPPRGT